VAEADSRLRYSMQPRIALELALIQATGFKDSPAATVKEEAAPKAQTASSVAKAKPVAVPTAVKEQAPVKAPVTAKVEAASKAQSAPESVVDEAAPIDIELIKHSWKAILADIKKADIGSYMFLEPGRPYRLQGHKLFLEFSPEYEVHMRTVCTKQVHKHLIEEKISEKLQFNINICGQLQEKKISPSESEILPEQEGLFPPELL